MAVLQRKELEASPLADLHAIAAELGLEGYRALRKEELIARILDAQDGEPTPDAAEDAPAAEEPGEEAELDVVDSTHPPDTEPEVAEEPVRFESLTALFAAERLEVPAPLEGVTYGKGSRVAIAGPPGAGATKLL